MNPILYVTHPLNGLFMVLAPIGLGLYVARRFKLGWRLWFIGAATFVLSQVGHIPFNALLGDLFSKNVLPVLPGSGKLPFQAVYLGLSAGLWEECARYAAYRWWAKDARSWGRGLMLGAGHGGVEAFLLGALVLVNFIYLAALRGADLSRLAPPEQIPLAQQQILAYWSMPWYASLLGAFERCLTLIFHLAASVLVLQVFLRKQLRWLWLAVFWHALLDALAVFSAGTWGPYVTEAILAAFTLLDLAIIFGLRSPEPPPTADGPGEPLPPGNSPLLPEIRPPALPEISETPDNLDQTRFN